MIRPVSLLFVIALVACGGKSAAPAAPAAAGGSEVRDATPESLSQWTRLGERSLKEETGKSAVHGGGTDAGRFTSVRFVLKHGKAEVHDVAITLEDGTVMNIPHRLKFGDGVTSRAIDIAGDPRVVREVAFRWSGVPAGKNAQLEIWAH